MPTKQNSNPSLKMSAQRKTGAESSLRNYASGHGGHEIPSDQVRYVYFAHLQEQGELAIKIGISCDPTRRVKQLTSEWRTEYTEICRVVGRHRDEAALHLLLRSDNIRSEYFKPSRMIFNMIHHINATGALPDCVTELGDKIEFERLAKAERVKADSKASKFYRTTEGWPPSPFMNRHPHPTISKNDTIWIDIALQRAMRPQPTPQTNDAGEQKRPVQTG